jgi:hypothetical protein
MRENEIRVETSEEFAAVAHLRDLCHDSNECPICTAFRRGETAAINEIATGSLRPTPRRGACDQRGLRVRPQGNHRPEVNRYRATHVSKRTGRAAPPDGFPRPSRVAARRCPRTRRPTHGRRRCAVAGAILVGRRNPGQIRRADATRDHSEPRASAARPPEHGARR